METCEQTKQKNAEKTVKNAGKNAKMQGKLVWWYYPTVCILLMVMYYIFEIQK